MAICSCFILLTVCLKYYSLHFIRKYQFLTLLAVSDKNIIVLPLGFFWQCAPILHVVSSFRQFAPNYDLLYCIRNINFELLSVGSKRNTWRLDKTELLTIVGNVHSKWCSIVCKLREFGPQCSQQMVQYSL